MNSPASEPTLEVKTLLESLIKAVVKQPEEVKIRHTVHGSLVAFGIEVAQDDVRRVIGAKGKHVKAIQLIVTTLCRSINMEAQVSIVQDSAPPPRSEGPSRVFPLAAGRDFRPVRGLLERTVQALANSANDVEVKETPFGTNHIFEIQANQAGYNRLYGPTSFFDYGEDGLIIGSIKNIFDAIGKNHGKLVRIVMTKKA